MSPEKIPLSLYVHIPWCIKKCPYCDFNSHKKPETLDENGYIDHLLADLHHDYDGREIKTIFIGGGTPSLLSEKSIGALLNGIQKIAKLASDVEITLEANPGTFEYQKFKSFRAAGINRLSIGIQSYQAAFLKLLGRIHNDDEAKEAVAMAQKAGFDRINTDLMFALPNQSVAQAISDLKQSIQYGAEHISWYQLTIEPNTAFYTHPPKMPSEEQQNDIYLAGKEILEAAGYQQYEVSAWTRKAPSAHNVNYWEFGDYIGIGAGAHGKKTEKDQIIRTSKFSAPQRYQSASGKYANPYLNTSKVVARGEQPFEFMMNALRLSEGVNKELFIERTQCGYDDINEKIHTLIKKELLRDSQRYQTTDLGFILLNNVLEAFLN